MIKLIKENNKLLKLKENKYNLTLIIELPKPYSSSIKIFFELLNIEYYLTQGPFYKRINKNPFFASLNSNVYNLQIIKEILKREKIINNYNIDNYRYYDEKKKGFIKIDELKYYDTPPNILILELHFNKYIDPIKFQYENFDNDIINKIIKMKNEIKFTKKNKKYDLIYLYASPIITEKGNEMKEEINYRLEIKSIIKLFNKSGKSFNCLFECTNEKIFSDFLIQKRTKILHISSHGDIDKDGNYYLLLEDKGKQQNIKYDKLEKILKANSSKLENIDLVFVATCHSEGLGQLFKKYGAKNVIYIESLTPISNIAALKFSEYFYEELVKGNKIEESFYKIQKKLQSEREVILYNQNNCCCKDHKHKTNCYIYDKNNKTRRKNFHNKFHKKICNCYFSEFHTPKINCDYHKYIKQIPNEEKKLYKLDIEEFPDKKYVKICCCNHNAKHNEHLKFIFESNIDVAPFQLQEKGNLQINKNSCVFDFDDNKNFSVIGREKNMEEIYNIITDNNGQKCHFIIIYGGREIGKQDFAESACVYLFERKLIKKYENFELKSKYDLDYIKNKVLNYNKKLKEKIVIIIKISYILDEEISFNYINDILNEINVDDTNLYFIILLGTQKEKIDIKAKNQFDIIYLTMDQESAKKLIVELAKQIGLSSQLNNLTENDLNKLYELINYQPKKLKILADLICKGMKFEELKNYIKSKKMDEKNKNIIEELNENKELSKIYYLLSNMPSGLPNSLIKLIYPDLNIIINQKNNLIFIDHNHNWNHLYDYKKEIHNFYRNKNNERQDCILNCIKIYSKLLFIYIQNNKQKFLYPDGNIHYIFNSYNDTGIWKTFDFPM